MIEYSIIIPVHNNGITLDRTMQSVLQQIKQFDEIILVENGSTDDSLSKCYTYQQKDTRIKVIVSEQVGVSHARNVGIKAASGHYLFLLDADDTIQEQLLFQLDCIVRQFRSQKQTFDLYEVNFNHYFSEKKYVTNPFILPQGSYAGDVYLKDTIETFHEESKFMAWRFLYRRDFFIANDRFFPEDITVFEDIAFMQRYLTKDVTIYVTGHIPFVNYLFHAYSVTQTQEGRFAQALQELYRTMNQPSELEQTYVLSLASKVLSENNFIQFATDVGYYDKKHARVAYQKFKIASFFRRLKRRWQSKI